MVTTPIHLSDELGEDTLLLYRYLFTVQRCGFFETANLTTKIAIKIGKVSLRCIPIEPPLCPNRGFIAS